MTTAGLWIARLIVLRWIAQLLLEHLNRRHVLAHAHAVPEAFRTTIDPATYAKSIQYTLARGRLSHFNDSYSTLVLLLALFSGVLPWAFQFCRAHVGDSAWAMAAFLFIVGFALTLTSLPVDWYDQFRLEARFGFNTTTQK